MPRLISSLPLEIEIMTGVSPNEAFFFIGLMFVAYSLVFLPRLILLPIELTFRVLDFIFEHVFSRPEPKPVRRQIKR